MGSASWSRLSRESPPSEFLEGRKHCFQEANLPNSSIPLQKLDDLSRAWSQGWLVSRGGVRREVSKFARLEIPIRTDDPANEARLRLAEVLGQPPEKRWALLWRSITAELPLDD
jgi:hypothetical protein